MKCKATSEIPASFFSMGESMTRTRSVTLGPPPPARHRPASRASVARILGLGTQLAETA